MFWFNYFSYLKSTQNCVVFVSYYSHRNNIVVITFHIFLTWLYISQPGLTNGFVNLLNHCFTEEEEFLGELADSHLNESIFNRDQVFAHLNFRLDAGSFKLVNTKHSNTVSQTTTALPVVEVEFSDLRWDSEMRPRSSTWEFSMSLGALFVRDKLTTGTLFPALVCPQGRESQVSDLFFKCLFGISLSYLVTDSDIKTGTV